MDNSKILANPENTWASAFHRVSDGLDEIDQMFLDFDSIKDIPLLLEDSNSDNSDAGELLQLLLD